MPVSAQFAQIWSSDQLRIEQSANLYLTWQGRESVDGFVLELPTSVSFQKAVLVRTDRQAEIPLQARFSNGRYVLSADLPIRGSHTLILQVRADRETSRDQWILTPYKQASKSAQTSPQLMYGARVERTFRTSRSSYSSRTRALALETALIRPIEVRRSVLPSLNPNSAFTLSFWLKTTDLGGVLFSTWNGKEQNAYPLEIQMDKQGQLVFYRGQQGLHQSLFTKKPIADGQWHHVAVVNQPNQKAYLAIDGVWVDSLSNATVPNTFANRGTLTIGNRAENATQGFKGYVQDVQFWNRARSESAIRSTMKQPIVGSTDAMTRLTFDQQPDHNLITYWSPEAKRVPSDLVLRYPIQDFNVAPRHRNVYISWRVQGEDTRQFMIERSFDGQTFEAIGAIDGVLSDHADIWRSYSFNDTGIESGEVLYYRVRQVFEDRSERYSGIIKVGRGEFEVQPAELIGNSPNPFNPQTRISYQLQKVQMVEISVWNLRGTRVSTLVQEEQNAGIHYIDFNASDLPSGIYLVRMQTPFNTQTLKITLEK